jgi:hypothetical protein
MLQSGLREGLEQLPSQVSGWPLSHPRLHSTIGRSAVGLPAAAHIRTAEV